MLYSQLISNGPFSLIIMNLSFRANCGGQESKKFGSYRETEFLLLWPLFQGLWILQDMVITGWVIL